jgi:nitrogen regulatory protein P-II 1
MKLVRAVVREEKIQDVIRLLDKAEVPGMTVSRASGRGATKHVGVFRGYPYALLMEVCSIEVLIEDARADDVARLILDGAHTGERGDGLVFVLDVAGSYSVRTRWFDVA